MFFFAFPIFDFAIPTWTRRWICGIPSPCDSHYDYVPGIEFFCRRYVYFSSFTPDFAVGGFHKQLYDKFVYNNHLVYPSLRLSTALALPSLSKPAQCESPKFFWTKARYAVPAKQAESCRSSGTKELCTRFNFTVDVQDTPTKESQFRLPNQKSDASSETSAVFPLHPRSNQGAPLLSFTSGMTTACSDTDFGGGLNGESQKPWYCDGIYTGEPATTMDTTLSILALNTDSSGGCTTQFQLDGRCSLFAVPNVDDLQWSTSVAHRACNTASSSTSITITHEGVFVFSVPILDHPSISHVEFSVGAQRVKGLRQFSNVLQSLGVG